MKPVFVLALAAIGLGALAVAAGAARDTKPPSTPAVSGITTSNRPLLVFAAKDNVTPAAAIRYQCSTDGGSYRACKSGTRWSLSSGAHALRVRALDRAGNRSSPRSVGLRVLATPTFTRVAYDSQFEPGDIVAGGGAIWLGGSNGIHRVDPAMEKMSLLAAGPNLFEVAYGHGSVWTSTFEPGAVRRLDAATGAVLATIETPGPVGIAADSSSLWATGRRDGSIRRIDPTTNTVVRVDKVGPDGAGGPGHIAVADDGVWVGASLTPDPRLVRVDPATGSVTLRANTGMCGEFAVSGGTAVHVCSRETTLALVDRSTGAVRKVRTPCSAARPLVVGNATWVPCNQFGGLLLLRIDAASGRFVEELHLQGIRQVERGVVAGDSVWLASPDQFVARLESAALAR